MKDMIEIHRIAFFQSHDDTSIFAGWDTSGGFTHEIIRERYFHEDKSFA